LITHFKNTCPIGTHSTTNELYTVITNPLLVQNTIFYIHKTIFIVIDHVEIISIHCDIPRISAISVKIMEYYVLNDKMGNE